jgi:nitrite reductase/ring-hydroxylating ferredoxin subunit
LDKRSHATVRNALQFGLLPGLFGIVECPNHDRRFDYRSAEAKRRPAWVSLLTTR